MSAVQPSAMARRMVCEQGRRPWPRHLVDKEEAIFLGREFAQHKELSENTAWRTGSHNILIDGPAHARRATARASARSNVVPHEPKYRPLRWGRWDAQLELCVSITDRRNDVIAIEYAG